MNKMSACLIMYSALWPAVVPAFETIHMPMLQHGRPVLGSPGGRWSPVCRRQTAGRSVVRLAQPPVCCAAPRRDQRAGGELQM